MKNNHQITDHKVLNVLDEVETKIKDILGDNLSKIIMYGSYARNEQSTDSDVDIIVLTTLTEPKLHDYKKAVIDVMVELSLKYDLVLSIIMKNYSQFQNYVDVLPFYMNIQNEGIEIYG